MAFEQMNIFDFTRPMVSVTKPIRLIELFSGVGSQAMALRNLGVNFETYLTCEWEIHAVASYHEIHTPNDRTDYSKDLTDEELIRWLTDKGISVNGKVPLTEEQVRRHAGGENWRRKVYNDIKATNNLVNISQAKGVDLKIVDTEHFTYLLTYLLISLSGFEPCRKEKRHGKRNRYEIRAFVGS